MRRTSLPLRIQCLGWWLLLWVLALLGVTGFPAFGQPTLSPLPRDEALDGIAGVAGVAAIGDAETGYTYLAMGAEGIAVLAPPQTWMGSTSVGGFTRRLARRGTTLCVAVEEIGLQLVDVSNPRLPRRLGRVDLEDGAVDVVVSFSTAYVADRRGGIHGIDIANPAEPVRRGGLPPTTSAPVPLRLAAADPVAVAGGIDGHRRRQ